MTVWETYAETLEEVEATSSIKAYQRRTIREVVELLRGKRFVSTRGAADRLGVASINTIKRLAEDGFLVGAFRNERGTWQIPLSAVVALEKQREQTYRDFASPTKGIRISNKVSHRLPR